MAARRPSSVCLFCQSRQTLVGRRRLTTTTARRQPETVALTPEDDGFLLSKSSISQRPITASTTTTSPVPPDSDDLTQWRLHSPVDDLREAMLSFDALWKRRDLRIEVLRNLSNPWPDIPKTNTHNSNWVSKSQAPLRLPEADAAPIPHAVFRRRMKDAIGDKEIRKILRLQLLRCEWPKEIFRIVAVAMQNPKTALNLSLLAEPLMRALYRCRNNVSDPEVLRTLNVILSRYALANLSLSPLLLQMGLKFAARARSLGSMKRYLRLFREAGLEMSSNVFRAIIAKFSIGHRGLGEIRNGRWRREQLLQVLNGFPTDLSPQPYHLGSFLVREDWQYLHGWIAILGRCKDTAGVWREWELWKQSPARMKPRRLGGMSKAMTTRRRGDAWFVEQMAYTDNLEICWRMFGETGLLFSFLKTRVRMKMLDGVEYAGSAWSEDVRNALLEKYDIELRKIEEALGAKWTPYDGQSTHEITGDGENVSLGQHILTRPQEETLERLGAPDFRLEEDFGFPYGEGGLGLEERKLNEAEEGGLATAS